MFIAALYTIAKIWKQPKSSSIDEWINKMWYVCVYIYIYAILSKGCIYFVYQSITDKYLSYERGILVFYSSAFKNVTVNV